MEILLFFLLLGIFLLFILYINEKNKNKEIEDINTKVKEENKEIDNENQILKERKDNIEKEIKAKQNTLDNIQNTINNANEVARQAFINYNDLLDKEYDTKEKEYEESVKLLEDSYAEIQAETLGKLDKIKIDLEKMATTRAAAIQAQLEEEKVQQQHEFYSLSIEDIDKREVKILQSIESELRDPRPIRMII